jgi:hypothetical protein
MEAVVAGYKGVSGTWLEGLGNTTKSLGHNIR